MPVKVIKVVNPSPATPAQETITTVRVAAYCRVSTDSEEQESSYDAQVSHYTSYITSHPGWTLAGIFADEGISGTQATTRPEFNRMIKLCEEGQIDLIITKSISRFARNTLDCLNYIRKLKALKIAILFEKECINTLDEKGEFLVTILASIAQQESASISQNVRMGIQFGFQEGHGRLNYSTFLGYTSAGKPGTYEIVPEEADLVRRIYREYLEGDTPSMIASHLMADGFCAPAGGDTWFPSTVLSILKNEKYCGDLLMQKYFVEDFLTHKIVKNTGQKPKYFVENNHAPIVPKDVFYQVQGERQRRDNLPYRPLKGLKGMLVCGKCGRVLKRYVKPDEQLTDWRCRERAMVKKTNTKEQPGCKCDCRVVLEKEVKEKILMALNSLPEHLGELEEKRKLLKNEISRVDILIDELNRRIEELEEKKATSDDSVLDFIRGQIQEVRKKKDSLFAERADYANQEMQARMLVELVEGELTDSTDPADPGVADEKMSTPGMADEKAASACTSYEDFFNRTRRSLPAGVVANGSIVLYDDQMVVRYISMIVVHDWDYEVVFKGGVSVRV